MIAAVPDESTALVMTSSPGGMLPRLTFANCRQTYFALEDPNPVLGRERSSVEGPIELLSIAVVPDADGSLPTNAGTELSA
jgi:hypothetical protein